MSYPGRVVTASQIRAIVHLVSASIPYLPAENVAVVDNTGNLLTDTEGESAMTLTGPVPAYVPRQWGGDPNPDTLGRASFGHDCRAQRGPNVM